jgi:stage II sporulation protein AA (anti-sigma F factor antagonist)
MHPFPYTQNSLTIKQFYYTVFPLKSQGFSPILTVFFYFYATRKVNFRPKKKKSPFPFHGFSQDKQGMLKKNHYLSGQERKIMSIRIESDGETVTAFLEGEIDHHTATEMRQVMDAELLSGTVKLLIMDFRDVTFMDSSGIGLVMGRYRQIQYNDGQLQIINTSPQIYKVMRIAGLQRLAVIEKGEMQRREPLL